MNRFVSISSALPFEVHLEIKAVRDGFALCLKDREGHSETAELRLDLARKVGAGRTTWKSFLKDFVAGNAGEIACEDFGQDLFRVIFEEQPELRIAWNQVWEASGRGPLDFRLDFYRESESMAALPFELLSHDHNFLFLRPGYLLRRSYLQTPEKTYVRHRQPRLLLAWACPPRTKPFDPTPHLQDLADTLGESRFEVVPNASLEEIDLALRRSQEEGTPFHHLGILAHSGRARNTKAYLKLEKDGATQEISAQKLGRILTNRQLELVLLCSCQSSNAGSSAFSGLGQQLLSQAGADLPVVVASQADLPIRAGIALVGELFAALEDAAEPAAALAEVRLRLEMNADFPAAWAAPVLLCRPQASTDEPESVEWLKGVAGDRLTRLIESDPAGTGQAEFFQKYVYQLYFQRKNNDSAFDRFLGQPIPLAKPIFLISGKAGKGKTNLICHLAQLPMVGRERCIPLLLGANDLKLDKRSLEESLVEQLFADQKLLRPKVVRMSFVDWAEWLAAEGHRFLIFLDGLNEIEGAGVVGRFNRQLGDLLERLDARRCPAFFCISCRTETWPLFRSAAWAQNGILVEGRPSAGGEPSLELEDFDLEDIDPIIAAYFHWFAIRGSLIRDARRAVCDPLMLRYFCAGVSQRGPDKTTPPENIKPYELGERDSLRKKDVFDHFVKNRRDLMMKAASKISDIKDSRAVYTLTTHYLISLAYRMYQLRRPYLAIDEIIEEARRLHHPDAELAARSHEEFLRGQTSIFHQLVSEGIVISKYDAGSFSFTFETYFEFTLGRYLALERWPALGKGGEAARNAILADLELLIEEHRAAAEKDNFHNIFGAIGFAILVVEEPGEVSGVGFDPEFSALLFPALTERIIQLSARNGLDWLQLACATLRETRLATTLATSNSLEAFGGLMKVLENVAERSDWVILWDLEETLAALARTNPGPLLQHLHRWAANGIGLKPIYAIHSLAKLSHENPAATAAVLLELAGEERFRGDFWLARTLIGVLRSLAAKHFEPSPSETAGRITADQRQKIRRILWRLAENAPPLVRGMALPAIPFVGGSEDLERILNRVGDETWSWAWCNLAFSLAEWAGDREWLGRILLRLAQLDNAHVKFAVGRVLEHQRDRLTQSWQATIDKALGDWSMEARSGNVAIVYSPIFLEPAYDHHVECRERIEMIVRKLESVAADHCLWVEPRVAKPFQIRWVHHIDTSKPSGFEGPDRHRDGSLWPRYFDDVEELNRQADTAGRRRLGGPSELRYESFEVAQLSAGAVLEAIDQVVKKRTCRMAFALNRPPGHLANNMICIFNNIAIGAHYATKILNKQRVLILDFDAHHGSHTNRAVAADPQIVYFSIHLEGSYAAEAGAVDKTGIGPGEGYSFNLVYPQDMGDDGYAFVVEALLEPVIQDWRPELVLLSAGFDGHFDDPLTRGCLTERAYIHLAERLRHWSAKLDFKMVASLEGGYGLEGMTNSLVHMARVFGDWQIGEETIGFCPSPVETDRQPHPEAIGVVRETVRRRALLVAQQKAKDSAYPFEPNASSWRLAFGEN